MTAIPEGLLEGSALIAARRAPPDAVRLTLALPRWCGRPEGMPGRIDVLLQGIADPEALLRFAGATAGGGPHAAGGIGPASPVELAELRALGAPRVVLRDAGGSALTVACRAVAIEAPE